MASKQPAVTLPAVCVHGGLRRQCEPCDLADRLDAAEAEVGRLTIAMRQVRDGMPGDVCELTKTMAEFEALCEYGPPGSVHAFVAALASSLAAEQVKHDEEAYTDMKAAKEAAEATLAATARFQALYFDLILQVENKHPGETRHDTARRYIQQAEQQTGAAMSAAPPTPPKGGQL